MITLFRLVTSVFDRNMFISKVTVFINRAQYAKTFVFYY